MTSDDDKPQSPGAIVEADRYFAKFQATRSPGALASAFDHLAPELLLLAGHLMRDSAAAEDLVQDTFLRAIENVDRYDSTRGVQPWMVSILTGLVRHEWRRRRRRMPIDRAPTETVKDPNLEVQAREFLGELRQAFTAIHPLYRDVLRLHLLRGMSLSEVARILDRPHNTVKTQQRRGLAELRRALPNGLWGVSGQSQVSVTHRHGIRPEPANQSGHAPSVPSTASCKPPIPTPRRRWRINR